ncbi:ribosomal RNA processing protein 1 homolog A isoform X2 [Sorex araneus]|uniref:ribosomal RNA processing protein 1 homolog A isoform X2 n=1 Tax=Sorex araneus TaxID=42254 RepID=UPI002433AC0C|nr:ribosomal RNA processing protein 1 homolog A isoform X2 [Sorex araneus]
MAACAQLPPEVQLAQRLAGNEQVTRDRAVRRLRKFIVARTEQAAGGFTHDELLKVWKGLFYCMWMQDKPLLQEDLGKTISQLLHAFQTTEAQHLFLRTFWQTMIREWVGIDRLRLDKFYLLMRMVLHESLKALQMRGWEERPREQLLELLTAEILHPDSQAPGGVKSHFLDIFLEELTKVGADELTAEQNLRFIEPFCRMAAQTGDPVVLHHVTCGILEPIIEQAPLAIEALMDELDTQRGADKDSEQGWSADGAEPDEEEEEDDEEEEKEEEDIEEEGEAGDNDDEDDTEAVLQFDYEAVANRLFEMASSPSTPSHNRKRLYKVVRRLQNLAEGVFPEDDVPEKVYEKLQAGRRPRKARRSLPKARKPRDPGDPEMQEPRPEQPGGPGRRGAHKKCRRPRPPRRKAKAGGQEPPRKKSRRGRK